MTQIHENMSYNDLKEFLQNEIKKITLNELYELSFQFNDDMKYLPREYKKKYTESVLNVTTDTALPLLSLSEKLNPSISSFAAA